MKTGIQIIEEERERQVFQENFTAEHDRTEHPDGDLISAAISYCIFAWWRTCKSCGWTRSMVLDIIMETWFPWSSEWWKPSENDQIRNLAKAGALIAAEIDRLNTLKINPIK